MIDGTPAPVAKSRAGWRHGNHRWNRRGRTALIPARRLATMMKVAAVLAAATLWLGCATLNVIPGTKVPDNRLNREILAVCEQYRHALPDRGAPSLLALPPPNHHHDSAPPNAYD